MPSESERIFMDQVGRHYARHYGVPPMIGRVGGWLLICDPPEQTVAEIAEALGASRSAIGSAVTMLETWGSVLRTRRPGERADRVRMHPSFGAQGLESPGEYAAIGALARQGLEALGDVPPARRARLLEMAAFADFLVERMPQLAVEWRERRDALRASGELPEDS